MSDNVEADKMEEEELATHVINSYVDVIVLKKGRISDYDAIEQAVDILTDLIT